MLRGKIMRKKYLMIVLGIVLLLVAITVSLMFGTKNYSISAAYEAVFNYNSTLVEHQILHDIRLPRSLAAVFIGAYLSLSGCVMQVLTRNPLAEPSLLGVSNGAAFALVVTMAFFPTLSLTGTTVASIIGAGITVMLVFALATFSKGGSNPVKLSLAGVALGMFLSSLSSAIGLYFDVSKNMSFWYAGGLSNMDWSMVRVLLYVGIPGLIIVLFIAKALNVLHLGEDVSKSLGINLNVIRICGVVAVLLLTGGSVAVSGAIGFVGLVVPHICRMLVGNDHRLLLPLSALFGSVLLLLADVGARFINPPYETPVGVVTALIGVPFFLYLVRRGRRPSF